MLRFRRLRAIVYPARFPGPVNEDGFFRFRNVHILAPFHAVIDHSAFNRPVNESVVYYHVYDRNTQLESSTSEVFKRADADVQRYQINPRIPLFRASWILVVTWVRIYAPAVFRAVEFLFYPWLLRKSVYYWMCLLHFALSSRFILLSIQWTRFKENKLSIDGAFLEKDFS